MSIVARLLADGVKCEVQEGKKLRIAPAENITPELRKFVRDNKERIIQELSGISDGPPKMSAPQRLPCDIEALVLQGKYSLLPKELVPSFSELAHILGDEWPKVRENLTLHREWLRTIITNRMVQAGIIPPWFTVPAHCEKCGIVVVEGGPPNELLVGCPWCHRTA